MLIAIASDHAGFELKQVLVPFLKELGHDVEDFGAHELVPDDDYPDYISKVAEAVSNEPESVKGIVLGGSGQGEAIVANRFKNVRAVVFNGQYEPKDEREVPNEIEISREHNDANILSLGARFLSDDEAKEAVEKWLNTTFSVDERHVRRIKKIEQYGR